MVALRLRGMEMIAKAIDGNIVIHATQPDSRSKRHGYQKRTTEELPTSWLKNRLCRLGPKLCPSCGLCSYGIEYTRRIEAGKR